MLFTVFIGSGLGTHDAVTLSVIARCFGRRRGIMTGIAKAGAGLGQVLLAVGVVATALLLLAALAMKRAPVDAVPRRTTRVRVPEFAEVRRTRTFWMVCAMQLLFLPAVASVPLHIPVHGLDLGMTPTTAAALLTVIGGASIVSRLAVGIAVDRIGGRNTYLVLCFLALVISLLALLTVATHWMLFIVVAVYGFAHGGFFSVVSPTVAELFGTRAHGAILGGILFYGTIGAVVGPIMTGAIFDATGSYAYAFVALAAMGALGLALTMSLPPPHARLAVPSRDDPTHASGAAGR